MCIDMHFWLNVGYNGDIVSHTYTMAYVDTHWCGLWELDIPYVCLLYSLALWSGCLDTGGYGCHENNFIMILLHGDGCLVWLKGL